MTTNRTAIRRWLEVGGGTHRPPRGAWKARHRSILAPFTATLAASAAVGLGLVLVKAESQRRVKRRRAERRLGLLPGETLQAGLRRMAMAQAEIAAEDLIAADADGAAKAVHEARKAIKRIRAILRLLEGELGAKTCAREHATLRAAAGGLAGARDAEVMLATLEGMARRHPKKLRRRKGLARLIRNLEAERAAAERELLEPGNRLRVASELRTFAIRAATWELRAKPGLEPVAMEVQALYSSGRKRMRRASRKRGARIQTMHRWRKRVKDLRYATEALERRAPRRKQKRGDRSGRAAKEAAQARWLHELTARAEALGELLGEEHDLAVLGVWISDRGASAGAGRAARRRLLKLIARRRAKLRRRALRRGRVLYRRKPAAFTARLARAYARLS